MSCVICCKKKESNAYNLYFSFPIKKKKKAGDLYVTWFYVFYVYISDSEPPEITYCPNTIYSYTNRNSKEALVNWTEPSASDNSKNVTVHQIKGPKSGFSFRVGITEIRYQATDSNGNKSPECIFFVVVEGNFFLPYF